MEDQEHLFIGCVMGWEANSDHTCCEPSNFRPPVVTEFCPGGSIESDVINPTARMRELAAAGFMPIAIIYRDSESIEDYYVFERNGISDAVHMQLIEDSKTIAKTIVGQTASRRHSSCAQESMTVPKSQK